MIRVTVELFPHGQVTRGIVLGQFFIINDGTGSPTKGNYKISEKDGPRLDLKNYPREKGFLKLVEKSLLKIGKYKDAGKELRD